MDINVPLALLTAPLVAGWYGAAKVGYVTNKLESLVATWEVKLSLLSDKRTQGLLV